MKLLDSITWVELILYIAGVVFGFSMDWAGGPLIRSLCDDEVT